MRFPAKEIVEKVRGQYPIGTRVELTCMDDIQAPPIGTKGTVRGVDDTGSIMVDWDNGSGLNVVYGEDSCKIIHQIKITCYGRTEYWDSREEARMFYLRGYMESEGSEQNRYGNIYADLVSGKWECSDE